MKKLISLFFGLSVIICHSGAQTLSSPGSFLGYPLGSRYTPHFKIVNYFKQVAQAAPDRVKVEQYGETYEGRPLIVAFIASPENMQRLEAIRLNNLKLAGLPVQPNDNDKQVPDENAPAIVWLSYNVHGNEPSSSEAAMKTLYELTDPNNAKAKEWLQHTVVIIDPCINPDGRDRYVNWYNTAVGKDPNPDAQSREHSEPWPGGRTNHYNFDLNRDWAWQTQQETRQRIKKYNSWLPQVHVDFHEQGVNSPYYFAPAAEPYHDVITPWQREFQVLIGKNNAKYFDERGWLFFTKEEFDLFYPSYGDTYPTYSGAIGMTFEQGGGSRGGVAVITSDEDTLTLADRLEHHFTTGMSTIEVASRNSGRLIKEFRKYFADAQTKPAGEFKAWLIRTDQYSDRLERLKSLLERNNIGWTAVAPSSFTGIDYETGKLSTFRSGAGDIAINANQPKSNLLKVLFERSSHISDSVTYDITAWSIPFVYGLQAYGLNAYVSTSTAATSSPAGATVAASAGVGGEYAYVVRWTGMNSAKFLTGLLKKGVKTRYAELPFQSGGTTFEKGSLIFTLNGAAMPGMGLNGKSLAATLSEAAKRTGVTLIPVASGFVDKGADFGSGRVHVIHRPKVAVLTGEGVSSLNAGEVWHFFEQELDYPISQINAEDAGRINWKNYDVVILPNGRYKFLSDKITAEPFRSWVKEGGKIIAMENAVTQLSKLEWGIRQKGADDKKEEDKEKKTEDYSSLHRYENREREQVASSVPGSIYKLELDNSHPLAFGYPDHYYTLKQDDRVYEFIKEDGWNVGVIRKDNYISGFTGSKAKVKLKDGLIFGVQDLGRGEIVYLADDPLFRSFWENGKLLFCNAVFLVGE
jgi:hypothetical protein